jgi:hypothetical protein
LWLDSIVCFVVDLESGKFNALLLYPACGIIVVDDGGQWSLTYNCDGMFLDVMRQHLGSEENFS